MRLMSYNIEWFDDWFEPDNSLKTGPEAVAKFDAIAAVMAAIDPDLIGITEGPNTTTTTGQRDTVTALETFAAAKGLRQSKAMMGFPSAGRQEIAVLFDPAKVAVDHAPGGSNSSKSNPPFNKTFYVDSDGDGIDEVYKHYRPPLEAKVTPTDGTAPFWMIVAHAKSKGIFSAMDQVHFERTSTRNRRKLFAECTSIRKRVDDWLEDDRPVVVMGDINDGPGFDYYERRFGRSAVELIIGDPLVYNTILRYPLGRPKFGTFGWEPSTARFTDRFTEDRVNALIDHIIVSPQIALTDDSPYIVWNPFQTDAAKALKSPLLDASDHFPVTLDLA
ncbi:MAG: endonuclease/exonuclease/phosphatase family protein [Pseudomonadota bacterium]